MKELHLDVISPQGQLFGCKCQSVQLPGANGLFAILPNHAPLVAALGAGRMKITVASETDIHFDELSGSIEQFGSGLKGRCFQVEGGLVEVGHNKVTVLASQVTGQSEGAA